MQSNQSMMTVHEAQIQEVESAIVGLPSRPYVACIVDLPEHRMQILNGWTSVNKTREIHIDNFYADTLGFQQQGATASAITTSSTEMQTDHIPESDLQAEIRHLKRYLHF